MRTPEQLVTDTVQELKRMTRGALVVVQLKEGKIVGFDFVPLETEEGALERLTKFVSTGWVPVGVFVVVTAPIGAQMRWVSSGPLREFTDDPQVRRFLTGLVNSSRAYYTKPGPARTGSTQLRAKVIDLMEGVKAEDSA